MNYERLYSYRFRDIDQDGRIAVWKQIGPHVHELMARPQKVLDPAAGRGEFIGAVPARETWAVDAVSYEEAAHKPDTTVITASIMDAELPQSTNAAARAATAVNRAVPAGRDPPLGTALSGSGRARSGSREG